MSEQPESPRQPEQPEPLVPHMITEAARKTALLWATWEGSPRPRPLWHVWHEGAVCVVTGGDEQPAPGLSQARRAEVTLRSKDTGARLVTWPARVEVLTPGTEAWQAAVDALRPERLNAAPGDLAARWAASSTVVRLVPAGEPLERPGAYDTGSHAAPPQPTPATTRGKRPPVLHRRQRRQPKL